MTTTGTRQHEFIRVLCEEWTRFLKTRQLVITTLAAALAMVVCAVGFVVATLTSCAGPRGNLCPSLVVGPHGEAVNDKFYWAHQTLDGDGSITARLTSFTGLITYPPPNHDTIVPGVVPWAKGGVIVKANQRQGSAYAGVMMTGDHGVRMQSNFVHDFSGSPGGVSADSPRWLRLTRSADTLTGYESANGVAWTEIGATHIQGLPAGVEVGLFVTSPCDLTVKEGLLAGPECRFAEATVMFDHLEVQGQLRASTWQMDDVGAQEGLPDHLRGRAEVSAGQFTLTGSGDIAPAGTESGGKTIESTLSGTFALVLGVIVVAGRFAGTGGHYPPTSTARASRVSPSHALVARAVVVAGTAFVVGLLAVIAAALLGRQIVVANGNYFLPASLTTTFRIVLGTATLLAVAGVFGLSLGALLGRARLAIAVATGLLVVPYLVAVSGTLPVEWANWLLRITPGAGFAIQQSLSEYPQVANLYAPLTGYFPLAPWTGFVVLCAYTTAALGVGFLSIQIHCRAGLRHRGQAI